MSYLLSIHVSDNYTLYTLSYVSNLILIYLSYVSFWLQSCCLIETNLAWYNQGERGLVGDFMAHSGVERSVQLILDTQLETGFPRWLGFLPASLPSFVLESVCVVASRSIISTQSMNELSVSMCCAIHIVVLCLSKTNRPSKRTHQSIAHYRDVSVCVLHIDLIDGMGGLVTPCRARHRLSATVTWLEWTTFIEAIALIYDHFLHRVSLIVSWCEWAMSWLYPPSPSNYKWSLKTLSQHFAWDAVMCVWVESSDRMTRTPPCAIHPVHVIVCNHQRRQCLLCIANLLAVSVCMCAVLCLRLSSSRTIEQVSKREIRLGQDTTPARC